jgi:hypothetical protein
VDVQEGRLEVSLVEELTDDTHFAAAAHPLGVVVRQHRREKFAKIDSVRTE